METARAGQEDPLSPQLNDELYKELRMLVLRGLTPEQLRAHYRLNGAPEAFVTLVFEAATLLAGQREEALEEKSFWNFFRSAK